MRGLECWKEGKLEPSALRTEASGAVVPSRLARKALEPSDSVPRNKPVLSSSSRREVETPCVLNVVKTSSLSYRIKLVRPTRRTHRL